MQTERARRLDLLRTQQPPSPPVIPRALGYRAGRSHKREGHGEATETKPLAPGLADEGLPPSPDATNLA
jgi:hypothetical protein